MPSWPSSRRFTARRTCRDEAQAALLGAIGSATRTRSTGRTWRWAISSWPSVAGACDRFETMATGGIWPRLVAAADAVRQRSASTAGMAVVPRRPRAVDSHTRAPWWLPLMERCRALLATGTGGAPFRGAPASGQARRSAGADAALCGSSSDGPPASRPPAPAAVETFQIHAALWGVLERAPGDRRGRAPARQAIWQRAAGANRGSSPEGEQSGLAAGCSESRTVDATSGRCSRLRILARGARSDAARRRAAPRRHNP
jgi:hypothetical protein